MNEILEQFIAYAVGVGVAFMILDFFDVFEIIIEFINTIKKK